MTMQAFITSFAQAVGGDIKTVWTLLNGKAADLSALNTTDKTTVVAAINEVKADAGAAAVIDDATTTATETWSSTKIQTELTATEAAAVTGAVDQITNGAGAAYDTLIEIQTELQADDTVITGIITAQGKRVAVDQAQSFTPAEQLQGCQNLDIGDPTTDYEALYIAARDA